MRPSTFAWRVVCSCAAHTSPDTQGLPRLRQRCEGPCSWSGGSSSPRAEGAERTRGRASAGGPLSTDARRESRPPRKSPAQSGALAGPQDRVPAPAQRLAACWGRAEPFGHRAGRGCDGAAARAARGSAVSGRESRLPCHPPVAAPFTQDPAVTPAQARAVCRRENPSWTSVQLERCGPRVRACVCVRTPVDACALVCMCACVHACTCARVCTCRTPPPGRWPPLALPAPAGPSPWGPGGGRPAAWTGLAGAAAPPPSASRGCAVSAGEEDGRDQSTLETKVWEAHNPLIDKQIDQFLVVAR